MQRMVVLPRGPQTEMGRKWVFWWTCEWGPKSLFLPLCYVSWWRCLSFSLL